MTAFLLLLVPLIWSLTNVFMQKYASKPKQFIFFQLINWMGTALYFYTLGKVESHPLLTLQVVIGVANGGTLLLTAFFEHIFSNTQTKNSLVRMIGFIAFSIGLTLCLLESANT